MRGLDSIDCCKGQERQRLPLTICINILLLLKYLYFIFQIKTVSSSELKEIKQKKLELSESV